MKKLENFEELKATMINPLDNPDFYALLLCDDRYREMASHRGAFSMCHNYDLGSTIYKNYHDLLRVAIQQYLQNSDYQEYIKHYPNSTNLSYQKIVKDLSNALESPDKSDSLIQNDEKTVDRILGIGKNIDENNGKMRSIGWFYFKSHYLNPKLSNSPVENNAIKHRLYLAVDTNEIAEMANKIIEKCNQKDLPYDFKVRINFNVRKERQQCDSIVIYLTDEEQVVEYVNFINEIIEEDKELSKHIYKPSPHLGIVNDYIGYGFEPQLRIGKTSYSSLLRETVISIPTKKIAINILQSLANQKNIEKYQELIDILNRTGEKTPQEYEELRKYFSEYFKQKNMNLGEIKELRQEISRNLVKIHPQLPKDNMFNIDVEDVLYQLYLEKQQSEIDNER